MTHQLLTDLNKIKERILAGDTALDLQNDITKAESQLLEIGNVEACLVLSKLSMAHMIELGMTDPADSEMAGLLKHIPATKTQDFVALLTKLIAEVRNRNAG